VTLLQLSYTHQFNSKFVSTLTTDSGFTMFKIDGDGVLVVDTSLLIGHTFATTRNVDFSLSGGISVLSSERFDGNLVFGMPLEMKVVWRPPFAQWVGVYVSPKIVASSLILDRDDGFVVTDDRLFVFSLHTGLLFLF
jgi:hypothetical protein